MSYKMKCPRCKEDMSYIEDKELEALGWISMDCPNNCEDGYLIPNTNPRLVKEEESAITFSCDGIEMLKLGPNGDIFVKGNLAANDTEVVNVLREFASKVKE